MGDDVNRAMLYAPKCATTGLPDVPITLANKRLRRGLAFSLEGQAEIWAMFGRLDGNLRTRPTAAWRKELACMT
jgi:hypothetical protein